MKSLDGRIKLSSFVHTLTRGDKAAIYNPINQKVFYGNRRLLTLVDEFKTPRNPKGVAVDVIKKLCDAKILVDANADKINLEKIRSNIVPVPDINTLYLILSDKCNYACRYCFVEENIPSGYHFSKMTAETVKMAVDFFIKYSSRKKFKEMVFYGGEPLLNREGLEYALRYLQTKEDAGVFKKLNKLLFTNGSLVTPKLGKLFCDNGVGVCVSIDGWKGIHDEMRIFRNGAGTFDKTIKGYFILKDAGCEPAISCTIGKHNVDEIEKIVEYFATKLDAKIIGLNLPLDLMGRGKVETKYLGYVSKQVIKAFEVAQKYGIYEDRTAKLIRPFVKGYIRLQDCAGCGKQIVVVPDGNVGVCHAFLGTRKFFCGSVYDKKFNPNRDKTFQEWSVRSPFNMPKCYKCSALSICGGGCPYNAWVRHGDIWMLDDRLCVLSKSLIKKVVWDSYDKIIRGGLEIKAKPREDVRGKISM